MNENNHTLSRTKLDITLFLLFSFDFIVRMIYLFSTDNKFFGDATARLVTILWQKSGLTLLPHADWLPFPFWINAFFVSLSDDIIYTPRIISAIFASLCIIIIYKISCLLFSKHAAILSCLTFTFSLQLLLIETLTLSEPFFHFFSLVLVYYYFKKYSSTLNVFSIIVCSAFLCLTRLEGWVLCGVLFATSLFWSHRKYSISIFTGAGIGVIYWEITSTIMGKGFLRALLYSNFEVAKMYVVNGTPYFEIFWNSSMGLTMMTFVIFLLGFYLTRNNKLHRIYYSLVFLFFLPALYMTYSKSLFAEFRYFTVYAILFFPLVGHYLSLLTLNMSSLKRYSTVIIYFVIAITVDYIWVTSKFTLPHHMHLSPGFISSTQFVQNELEVKDTVVFLDFDNTWDRDLWRVYSDVQLSGIKKLCMVESHYWLGHKFTQESVDKCLTKDTVAYLILFPNGLLSSYFDSNKDKIAADYDLSEVGNFDNHRVIKLEPR